MDEGTSFGEGAKETLLQGFGPKNKGNQTLLFLHPRLILFIIIVVVIIDNNIKINIFLIYSSHNIFEHIGITPYILIPRYPIIKHIIINLYLFFNIILIATKSLIDIAT